MALHDIGTETRTAALLWTEEQMLQLPGYVRQLELCKAKGLTDIEFTTEEIAQIDAILLARAELLTSEAAQKETLPQKTIESLEASVTSHLAAGSVSGIGRFVRLAALLKKPADREKLQLLAQSAKDCMLRHARGSYSELHGMAVWYDVKPLGSGEKSHVRSLRTECALTSPPGALLPPSWDCVLFFALCALCRSDSLPPLCLPDAQYKPVSWFGENPDHPLSIEQVVQASWLEERFLHGLTAGGMAYRRNRRKLLHYIALLSDPAMQNLQFNTSTNPGRGGLTVAMTEHVDAVLSGSQSEAHRLSHTPLSHSEVAVVWTLTSHWCLCVFVLHSA
jgi:hypothetical protein